MAEALVAPEFGVWQVPGHAVRIEYSDAVMQQIRIEAVDGYHRIPHGGVETGAILFGTHEGDLVRILAWRRIPCEYATGPSFALSEKDRADLEEALRSWRADPELSTLEPTGWYHSHTRTEIFLSDPDLEFFERYFPEPWQVALVVRPASFTPTRAGFFFREADGHVHAEKSYAEFQMTPSLSAEPPGAANEPAAVNEDEAPVILPAPVETAPALAETELEPPAAEARPGRRWKWYAAGLIAMIVAAAAAAGIWMFQTSHQWLSLSASDAGSQLLITWDRTAGPIRDAVSGTLEIEEHGVRTEARLTPADLRSGSISYARQSGNIVVRLKVEQPGRAPVEEVTRFLKPVESLPQPAAPQPDPAPDPAIQAMEREAASMRTRIQEQDAQLSKLQKLLGNADSSKAGAPAPQLPSVPRADPPTTAKVAPKVAAIQAPAAAATVPQPKILGLPPAIEPVTLTPPTAVVATPVHPPVPVPSTPPPASGRIIWTGRFSKNGMLVIEGRHASTGAIVGTLPAGPARFSAYPGDLTDEGMTLFTPEAKYTRPQVEAAGARNGWNRTTYTFDLKRSARVRILEQPSSQNGYRVVLQSDTTKLGVLMLEWRVTE